MANRTYRCFAGKPPFAFGHGLSYSTFAYADASLSTPTARRDETITLKATVRNTSARAGDEVVQVYATAINPPVARSIRDLVAFERVPFQAGESKTIAFSIPVERLRR